MLVSISYEYILFIILSTRFLRNRSHVIALREKTRKNLTIGRSNCDFFPRSFYLSYRDTNPIMNIFDINCDIAQKRHNLLERFRDVATATSILRVIVQRRSSRLFLIEKKKRRRISNEIGNIRKHFSLRL